MWSPEKGQLQTEILTNYEGVVHLAGAPIMGGRLTASRRKVLWDSRIKSTKLLVDRIGEIPSVRRPKVLVSASAVGYYPYSSSPMDEKTSSSSGFVSELCQAWEEAAVEATQHGLRVVRLRIGLVLSPKGGALKAMYRMQKIGLGAVIGSGKQYVSWIHIEDLLRLIREALLGSWQGAYNATSPKPVPHRNFVHTLSESSRMPIWLPSVPGWLLRAVLGKLSELALKGQYVLPSCALAEGFRFRFVELPSALNDLLTTKRAIF